MRLVRARAGREARLREAAAAAALALALAAGGMSPKMELYAKLLPLHHHAPVSTGNSLHDLPYSAHRLQLTCWALLSLSHGTMGGKQNKCRQVKAHTNSKYMG